MVRLAEEVLRLRGIELIGLSDGGIVDRALHSTSDFPLLLGDVANKVLREQMAAAPAAIKQICRQATIPDFRNIRSSLARHPLCRRLNEWASVCTPAVDSAPGAAPHESQPSANTTRRQRVRTTQFFDFNNQLAARTMDEVVRPLPAELRLIHPTKRLGRKVRFEQPLRNRTTGNVCRLLHINNNDRATRPAKHHHRPTTGVEPDGLCSLL
jgi:hypothetical protein